MNFETKNVENKGQDVEELKKETEKKTEIKIDSEELAKKALEDYDNLTKLNTIGKDNDEITYQKTLDSIKDGAPETKEKTEAREVKRKEVVNKVLQMVIDNLQNQLDKKGLVSLLTPKYLNKEKQEHINAARDYQSNNLNGLNIPALYALGRPGTFTDKSVRKEIAALIKSEIEPEDLKFFEDGGNTVGHQLTDVSAG